WRPPGPCRPAAPLGPGWRPRERRRGGVGAALQPGRLGLVPGVHAPRPARLARAPAGGAAGAPLGGGARGAGPAGPGPGPAGLGGAGADLSWALTRGLPAFAHTFGTPTPYLVIAAMFPTQVFLVSTHLPARGERLSVNIGGIGGVAALAVAGTVALLGRRRQ